MNAQRLEYYFSSRTVDGWLFSMDFGSFIMIDPFGLDWCALLQRPAELQILPQSPDSSIVASKKYHQCIGFREPQEQRVSPLSISLYASGRMSARLWISVSRMPGTDCGASNRLANSAFSVSSKSCGRMSA